MKKLNKNILKLFLFVSLGLITTIVFTSASGPATVPSPPGMPVISNIHRHGCTVTWTPPEHDGGLPVIDYQIEYRYVPTGRWMKLDKIPALRYAVKDRVEETKAEFRVFAFNEEGPSAASEVSDPITFTDPY